MNRPWDKEAEAQYEREKKLAQSESSSNVGLSVLIGVFAALLVSGSTAVQWLFFGHPPKKDDLWLILSCIVFVPVAEWFYAPIRERREIRRRREIRIEAKLDYMLQKQEEIATRIDNIEKQPFRE